VPTMIEHAGLPWRNRAVAGSHEPSQKRPLKKDVYVV